jgi:polysaccharide pyruvyl transferase WcaK-like protein
VEWSDLISRINLKLKDLRLPIQFPLVIHQLLGHVFRGEWLEQSRFLSFCQSIIIAIAIFTDIIFKLFAKKFDYLFVREAESRSIIEKLKNPAHQKMLGDDVILLLPYIKNLKSKSASNSVTALNLKSFADYDYRLIKNNLEKYLENSTNSPSSQKIEYFCFGREPGPDDRKLLEILDLYYRNSLIIHDSYEEGWLGFIENLARVDVGLGCAYHFKIILSLFNIPGVGIYSGSYYKQKIAGVMKLLNQDAMVLSIDELVSEKDLAEVVKTAIDSHVSGEDKLEKMYETMQYEYVNAYKKIMN